MIPSKIHQTYKASDIPDACEAYISKLKNFHSNWEYHFYDDGDCLRIMQKQFPELLPIYERCSLPVQKADIFRLAIIYLRGGFYFDMDMDFHKPLDDLLEHEAIFALEKVLNKEECERLKHRDANRIANYAFGASIAHPFLRYLIYRLIEEGLSFGRATAEFIVLEQTGPGFVTTCYHDYIYEFSRNDIYLLPLVNGFCQICKGHCCQFGNYASHKHMGSWRWEG